ncbi:unnamed protein product [Ascophyllum nodosum]
MVLYGGHQDKPSVAGRATSVDATAPPAYPTSNEAVATSAGCCAAPGASPAVLRVRRMAIAIIIFHVIALCAVGFMRWGNLRRSVAQWIGSLMGIIMASVLLCVFNKCCYTSAAIVFAIGGIFDVIAMIMWIVLAQAFDDIGEDADYYYTTTISGDINYYSGDALDEATDKRGDIASGLAVPTAVAALTMFLGSAFAIMAVISWAHSGAPDAQRALEMPAVSIVGGPGTATHGANNSYTIPAAAVQRAPPAYSA